MTKQEKIYLKLAAKMLELAENEFTNHGCNDLDEDVLEVAKELNEKEFCNEFRIWNGNPDEDYPQNFDQIGDSSLMHFLADKLKSLSNL